MQRFYKFIVVFFILTANWLAAEAQKAPSGSRNFTTTLRGKNIRISPLTESQRPIPGDPTFHGNQSYPAWSFTSLPQDYYLKMLGFVCKAECAVEKKLKLPLALRVRAGSLDYVNKMEGKR